MKRYCCFWFTQLCLLATPWTAAHQASLSFTISRSFFKFLFIKPAILSNHLILCYPLLLLLLIFPGIKVFSNELALCMRWPKYRSFSFSISLSNEHSELISFRIDWFYLLAIQGLSRVFSSITIQSSIETCILWYVKQITSPGSMHETGCSGLMHWDDPEGWDGKGGGRDVQDGEHIYTHGRFMSMYGTTTTKLWSN